MTIPTNKNSKAKLTGNVLAGFKRADGCVRDARRVMMLGDTLQVTREDEPLVSVTPWVNPSLAAALRAGVSLEAPPNNAPCERLGRGLQAARGVAARAEGALRVGGGTGPPASATPRSLLERRRAPGRLLCGAFGRRRPRLLSRAASYHIRHPRLI